MLASIMRTKPITRRTILSRRDALTVEERATASGTIGDQVLALLGRRLEPQSIVALYAAKGSEVETAGIDAGLRTRGMRVVYPRIVGGDRRLSFHEVGIDELVPSIFGLREPVATAPIVALAELAAVIVPGLAFDRAGARIGWGRGHYDATLVAAPAALRVGLAFECQIVDPIAADPHDVHLHYVVTDAAIYRAAE